MTYFTENIPKWKVPWHSLFSFDTIISKSLESWGWFSISVLGLYWQIWGQLQKHVKFVTFCCSSGGDWIPNWRKNRKKVKNQIITELVLMEINPWNRSMSSMICWTTNLAGTSLPFHFVFKRKETKHCQQRYKWKYGS